MTFRLGEISNPQNRVAVLLCLLAPGTLRGTTATSHRLPGDVALMVDRNVVTIDEFKWFMDQERAGVFEYFGTKCNIEPDRDFWTRTCEGTTPRLLLQKRTVDRVAREKAEQILFLQLGLIQDIRYSAFLENLAKLNRDREQAVKDGRVIYGPVRYTQLQYYGHWKASLQIQAKGKLARDRLLVSEQEARAYYDQNKDRFKTADTTTLEIVTIEPKREFDAEKSKGSVASAAQDILAKVREGQDLERILRSYANKTDIKLSARRVDSLDNERVGELFSPSENAEKVLALQQGQCVLVADSSGTVQIIKCISRIQGNCLPFEAVKGRASARCLDQRYDRLVEELAKTAEVRINQEALELLLPP
jgi:hypothetical protein